MKTLNRLICSVMRRICSTLPSKFTANAGIIHHLQRSGDVKKWVYGCLFTALLSLTSQNALAIAYGLPDCTNFNDPTTCGHPNVARFSAMNKDTLSLHEACTGSVLQSDNKKVVFLFAAHCVSFINSLFANPDFNFNSIGVNLDPSFNLRADGENYVTGGMIVKNPAYDPKHTSLLANSQDLALAIFSATATNFKGETFATRWGGVNGALTPIVLTQDVAPSLETVVNSYANPTRDFVITAAGYGILELLDWPGPNKGGPVDVDVDGRRYSPGGLFLSIHPYTFSYSENPARGNSGPCFGDSGGPNYFILNNQEVVAGVTSSGDAVCRATNIVARIDTPAGRAMVNCARDPNKTPQQVVDCVKTIIPR